MSSAKHWPLDVMPGSFDIPLNVSGFELRCCCSNDIIHQMADATLWYVNVNSLDPEVWGSNLYFSNVNWQLLSWLFIWNMPKLNAGRLHEWLVNIAYDSTKSLPEAIVTTSKAVNLTHWGRDKMAAIFQTTFSNAFSSVKMYEFRLRFHWGLFPMVQLTIFQHWFR